MSDESHQAAMQAILGKSASKYCEVEQMGVIGVAVPADVLGIAAENLYPLTPNTFEARGQLRDRSGCDPE